MAAPLCSRLHAALLFSVLAGVAPSRAENVNGIWIPTEGTGSVVLLDLEGHVRGVFDVGGAPRGGAIDAEGNAWISRYTATGVARISADGTRIDIFSTGFRSKTLAVDRDGNIWITNQAIDTVTKMSPAGVVLGDFPTGRGPRVVALDRNGDVWITCKFGNEVVKLDAEGNLLARTPVGLGPRGLAIDRTGSVWVANLESDTLTKLSPTGDFVADFPVDPGPGGIAEAPDGNLWVTNSLADEITVLAPNGSVVQKIDTIPLGGAGPLNVAPDGDGNIWIVCKLSSTVLKFSRQGALLHRTVLDPAGRPEPFGDLTGILHAKLVDPEGDDDRDGLSNGFETEHGFNPFSSLDPAVRVGNVNGARGPVEPVLKINGTTGGGDRRVTAVVGEPLAFRVKVPPAGPYSAAFSLYAYAGEIDTTTIRVQPNGIGTSAIPTPLNGPNRRVITLVNSLGHRRALGVPRLADAVAPTTLGFAVGARRPVVVTIQGFIRDDGAPGGRGLSITNAITLEIR